MVQVDVFWSFAIGSSFAVAASRQLKRRHEEGQTSAFESPFFTKTVLFLAVIFAPSGMWLLWSFPSWETMHVGDRNLPGWLVALFGVTNITQGVLGYWVAHRLIVRDRTYAAYLCIVGAYFLMFFVLVHGWDGTGYQRFFSATPEDFRSWGATPLVAWFSSPVAVTLYIMGVFLLPVMLGWISGWLREGQSSGPSRPGLMVRFLAVVFLGSLGSAIGASLMVHALGWALGLLAFAAVAYFFTASGFGLYQLLYRTLGLPLPRTAATKPAVAQ